MRPEILDNLRLLDMNGRLISDRSQKNLLDVRGIPTGVYLLQFEYDNDKITESVIIKN